jgi:hypothetical protein
MQHRFYFLRASEKRGATRQVIGRLRHQRLHLWRRNRAAYFLFAIFQQKLLQIIQQQFFKHFGRIKSLVQPLMLAL